MSRARELTRVWQAKVPWIGRACGEAARGLAAANRDAVGAAHRAVDRVVVGALLVVAAPNDACVGGVLLARYGDELVVTVVPRAAAVSRLMAGRNLGRDLVRFLPTDLFVG
jgi:hypothetical protein